MLNIYKVGQVTIHPHTKDKQKSKRSSQYSIVGDQLSCKCQKMLIRLQTSDRINRTKNVVKHNLRAGNPKYRYTKQGVGLIRIDFVLQ